jgi:hypothetical protein
MATFSGIAIGRSALSFEGGSEFMKDEASILNPELSSH